MSDIPDERRALRAEVRIKNNLICTAIEEAGYSSIRAFADDLGDPDPYSSILQLVNMKNPARKQDGQWREVVIRMSDLLGCMPEDLFVEEQQFGSLPNNRRVAELTFDQIQHLSRPTQFLAEQVLQAHDLKRAIKNSLESLTPREERVLRLRFGLDGQGERTLEEIGKDLGGLNRERIRQIEARALRRIQHPSVTRQILDTCGGYENTGETDHRGIPERRAVIDCTVWEALSADDD